MCSNLAIVHLCNFAGIIEPEPVSARGMSLAIRHTVELLKYMFKMFVSYTTSIVGDGQENKLVSLYPLCGHYRMLCRVLDSIVKDCCEHILNMELVGRYNNLFRRYNSDC